MARRSRQHYVPVFYLRGFVDQTCPTAQEPYLWLYEKGRGNPARRAPKNVAAQVHFYSVETEEGGRDSTAEELLASIESCAAPIWRRLGDRDLCLTREERAAVGEFVACLATRTPSLRGAINQSIDRMARSVIEVTEAHYDELTDTQREEIGLSRAELRDACEPGRFRFEAGQGLQVGTMLSLVPPIARMMCDMKWAILHSPPDCLYVTSDAPVALANPTLPPSWPGGVGFAQPGVEVTLPVNARLALLFSWDGMDGHHDAQKGTVMEINLRTVKSAVKGVYAPARLQWLDALFAEYGATPESLG